MSPSKLVRNGLAGLVPAVLLCTSSLGPASAAPASDEEPSLAVFEIHYDKKNFEKTPEYSVKVEERIAKFGGFAVISRPDAEKSIAESIPPSADEGINEQADEIHKQVTDAEQRFFEVGPEAALEGLLKAQEALARIIARHELSERIRKEYVTAQLLLALVYLRNNSPDKAKEVVEELVQRVGSDPSINEDNYNPEVVALYNQVFQSMSTRRVGKITVLTNPPGADVYIDGQVQDRKTPATFEGLYPGRVTVQVKKEGRASRVKDVKLEQGVPLELQIDLNFESSLAFGAKRFGLVFRNAEDRKRNLPAYAAKLGEIVQADYVAFVGLGDEEGGSALEGYLVNPQTEQIIRQIRLATRPNAVSKSRIEGMAYFLLYGDQAATVYKPWYTNTVGWVLTGVGVVGGGLGALFYSSYTSDKEVAECVPTVDAPCERDYQGRLDAKDSAESSRTLAYASWGVGAASLIGGIVAFAVIEEEDEDAELKPKVDGRAKTTSVTPQPLIMPDGSLGVGVGVSF